MIELNKIYNEDCLEGMKRIPSGSVDLILTDLPYGNMKGAALDGWEKGSIDWDVSIDPKAIHDLSDRVLRKNGKMILFSQEPYTTRLITESNTNVPFSYRMIWEKDHFANSLISKKAPVGYFEDILVFSKKYDVEGIHPLRPYFKRVMEYIGLNLKQINSRLGHRRAEHAFYVDSTQFSLCTEKTYGELINTFNINGMDGFIEYEELKKIDLPSVFNLWEGNKYKPNILKYKKDYEGLHPTQKPLLLMEDLVKTFSNPGDVVVDLTCGSGTTAMAAINTNRNFIGFELDENYHTVANERIAKHLVERQGD